MIPEGWIRTPLHEVAEVRTGLAKGKSNLRDPVELPYLRVANVQDGHIDLSEVKVIQVERSQVRRYSLVPGDILMTEGGDFDKLGRGDVWNAQIPKCLHQNHVFAVRADHSRVEPAFLAALAASHYGRNYFLGCAKRSTNLASINVSQLRAFPVLLPPLAVQKRIATILNAWNQAISTTTRLLALSRVLQQAASDQLLRERSEWARRALSDFVVESRVVGSGGLFARKLTVKLYGRGVIAKNEKHRGSDSTQYYRRMSGQFIYSKLDFLNGAFGIVPKDLDSYESTLDLPAFDFCSGVEPRWFLHLVSSERFYRSQLGLANGGRKARRVNPSDLLGVRIAAPELEEQRAIADAIDTAIAIVNNYEKQLASLKAQVGS